MRRPLVIYDFPHDPSEFPYIWRKFFFSFLSLYCMLKTVKIYLFFIGDQAFLLSYDSAPRPPLPPLPSARCLSFSAFLCVAGRHTVLTGESGERGEGGGGGRGAKLSDREKAWSSLNHSILSGWKHSLVKINGMENTQNSLPFAFR